MGSFVENVNKLSLNLDTIVKSNSMFNGSVLPVLQEVADLDLQEVTEDFKKGNYLGNRKIDIDLSLNKLTSESVVSYSKAEIMLVSGEIISIPFLSGSSVLELTSHNDIRNYIVNDALWAGIQYTECTVEEATDTTPTIIRFRDADGHSSNIERVELTVYSGTAKDIKPVYFWAQTTSALQTIANRVGDIIALGNNIGNVIELSQRIDELNALQAQLTPLLDIHTNLAELLQVDDNAAIATTKAGTATTQAAIATTKATEASNSATSAAAQALIATNKANEIKSVTAQASTLVAGSQASVAYNSADGKFTFGIPKGDKGDRGEAFKVNAMGQFADRADYDTQPKDFSFFALDTSMIYFKNSDTSADWSVGVPFGKGGKGDIGLTGNGISGIAFLSTTHASGLVGQAGGNDTYRITYTDTTTHDFVIHNGIESVTTVAGRAGDVVLSEADITGLSSAVVHKTGDETIAGVKSFSSSPIVPNATTATQAIAYGQAVKKTGDETIAGVKTFSNNLNFASGTRITGDFSNATDSSRLAFETNVQNSFTVVSAFPNGTGAISSFRAFSTAQGLNSSFAEVYCDQTRAMVRSGTSGTGAYLPLTFHTGGSERMRIDSSGNVLVTGSGGLGYGTGSGGTVTQLTSKSTSVTLNKHCGIITMNNAALAAGASVIFVLYNSTMSASSNDLIVANIVASSVGNQQNYSVSANSGAAGTFITLKNESAGSLSEAVILVFAIIKGATA